MTTFERNAQILLALLFSAALAGIVWFSFNVRTVDSTAGNPYNAELAPIDPNCKMVVDHNEAWRHAIAEGWFKGGNTPWELRSKAYRPIPAEGVRVPISIANNGHVTDGMHLIKTREDYERAFKQPTHYNTGTPNFLDRALLGYITKNGEAFVMTDHHFGAGHLYTAPQSGSSAKYVYFHNNALGGISECFYKYGPGLPTPTPVPAPADDSGGE